MIARDCTEQDLREALRRINETDICNNCYGPKGNFENNIRFKKLEPNGKGFTFTLSVYDSSVRRGKEKHSAPGSRINAINGRHIAAACWHAHGRFFHALFDVNPKARVFSSFYKRIDGTYHGWITADGGNWIDGQIGSNAYPVMMSEACEC
jgi:hypothetical protein